MSLKVKQPALQVYEGGTLMTLELKALTTVDSVSTMLILHSHEGGPNKTQNYLSLT